MSTPSLHVLKLLERSATPAQLKRCEAAFGRLFPSVPLDFIIKTCLGLSQSHTQVRGGYEIRVWADLCQFDTATAPDTAEELHVRASAQLAAGDEAKLDALRAVFPELEQELAALVAARGEAAREARRLEIQSALEKGLEAAAAAAAAARARAQAELAALEEEGVVIVAAPFGTAATTPPPPKGPPPDRTAAAGSGGGRGGRGGRAPGRGGGRGGGRAFRTVVRPPPPPPPPPPAPPSAGPKRKLKSDTEVTWAGETIARETVEAAVAKQRATGTRFDWKDMKHALLSPGARGVAASTAELETAWKRWGHADPCAPRVYADGYDDEGYGDGADRAALDAMAETAREAVLAKRLEARQAAEADAAAAAEGAAREEEEEEEEEEAPRPAKRARSDAFKLGCESVTRQQLEAVVAAERAAGRDVVWAGLWSKLLPKDSARPTNTKNIRRNWERWHPDEEAGDEGEAAAGAEAEEEEEEDVPEGALHTIGGVQLTTEAINAAAARVTKTTGGLTTTDWAAAAEELLPGSGVFGEQLLQMKWSDINRAVAPPKPAA